MEELRIKTGGVFANRFEVAGLAGQGGMGAVYRCRDRYSGQLVALKVLHTGATGREDAERFEREAQLLAGLRHPGIVSFVGHGETASGQHFLAMEWLEGEDLSQLLHRCGPLSLRDCGVLVRRVAEALDVAHGGGIVHRAL